MLPTNEDIQNRFTSHEPTEEKSVKYATIRSTARSLAFLLVDSVPASRELSLALTKLEEAVMWANAGIARND